MSNPNIKPRMPTLNSKNSLSKNLVLALPFFEGGGSTTRDISGRRIDGTITGATWSTGRYGSALNFHNPGTDRVALGNPDSLKVADGAGFTVAAWVRPTDLSEAPPFGTIYCHRAAPVTPPNPRSVISVERFGTDLYVAVFNNNRGITWDGVIATGVFTEDVWTHVIFGRKNSGQVFAQVDGIQYLATGQTSGGIVTGAITDQTDAFIGAHPGISGHDWIGDIGSVCFWSRALSDVEMQNLRIKPFSLFDRPVGGGVEGGGAGGAGAGSGAGADGGNGGGGGGGGGAPPPPEFPVNPAPIVLVTGGFEFPDVAASGQFQSGRVLIMNNFVYSRTGIIATAGIEDLTGTGESHICNNSVAHTIVGIKRFFAASTPGITANNISLDNALDYGGIFDGGYHNMGGNGGDFFGHFAGTEWVKYGLPSILIGNPDPDLHLRSGFSHAIFNGMELARVFAPGSTPTYPDEAILDFPDLGHKTLKLEGTTSASTFTAGFQVEGSITGAIGTVKSIDLANNSINIDPVSGSFIPIENIVGHNVAFGAGVLEAVTDVGLRDNPFDPKNSFLAARTDSEIYIDIDFQTRIHSSGLAGKQVWDIGADEAVLIPNFLFPPSVPGVPDVLSLREDFVLLGGQTGVPIEDGFKLSENVHVFRPRFSINDGLRLKEKIHVCLNVCNFITLRESFRIKKRHAPDFFSFISRKRHFTV